MRIERHERRVEGALEHRGRLARFRLERLDRLDRGRDERRDIDLERIVALHAAHHRGDQLAIGLHLFAGLDCAIVGRVERRERVPGIRVRGHRRKERPGCREQQRRRDAENRQSMPHSHGA